MLFSWVSHSGFHLGILTLRSALAHSALIHQKFHHVDACREVIVYENACDNRDVVMIVGCLKHN